jgi:hypothetical protein
MKPRIPRRRTLAVLIAAAVVVVVAGCDYSADPYQIPYTEVPVPVVIEGTWSDWSYQSGGGCVEESPIDLGDRFIFNYTCADRVERRTRTNTLTVYEDRYAYQFHHHNRYSAAPWQSNCYIIYFAKSSARVEDWGFGNDNAWGDWIEKNPEGIGDLEAGHGCGHLGAFSYHREYVRVMRQVKVKRATPVAETGTRSVPVEQSPRTVWKDRVVPT